MSYWHKKLIISYSNINISNAMNGVCKAFANQNHIGDIVGDISYYDEILSDMKKQNHTCTYTDGVAVATCLCFQLG